MSENYEYNLLLDIQLPTVDEIVQQNYYEQPDEWSVLCPPKTQALPTNLTEDRLLADWELLKGDQKKLKEKEREFERLNHITIEELLEKEESINLKSQLIESIIHGHPIDANIIKHNLDTPFRSYLEIARAFDAYPELEKLIENLGPDSGILRDAFIYLGTVGHQKLQANLRASELIKQWLTDKEMKQLMEKGYIDVKKGKKVYRVHEDYSKRVEVFNSKSKASMYTLCGYVAEWREDYEVNGERGHRGDSFVHGDHFMSKVIAIKSDPKYYEEHSNKFEGRSWRQPGDGAY